MSAKISSIKSATEKTGHPETKNSIQALQAAAGTVVSVESSEAEQDLQVEVCPLSSMANQVAPSKEKKSCLVLSKKSDELNGMDEPVVLADHLRKSTTKE